MIKYNYKKLIALFVLAVMLLFALSACKVAAPKQNMELVKEVDFVLGTFGQIQIYAKSQEKGQQAIRRAFSRIQDIENAMSTSIKESDVFLLNEYAGIQGIPVNDDTLYVIERGLEYYSLTEGTFNIGIGALINLWGIGKEGAKVPSQSEIMETLGHINIESILVNNNTVKIDDPNMRIDLGGIAKGYAVDEAIKVLREEGIDSGLVNLGGDIYAFGTKPDGSPWNVGIQDPDKNSPLIASLPLSDKSIVTSGDYERFFIGEDGKRYHHIIDPKTGYPVENELRSVTIISDLSIDGDVLSTAIFILGLEKGMTLIESLPNVEGIIVTKDRGIYQSSGIRDLRIVNDSYKKREFYELTHVK